MSFLTQLDPDLLFAAPRFMCPTPLGTMGVELVGADTVWVGRGSMAHVTKLEVDGDRYDRVYLVLHRNPDGTLTPDPNFEHTSFGHRERKPRVQPPLAVRTALLATLAAEVARIVRDEPLLVAYASAIEKHRAAKARHEVAHRAADRVTRLEAERVTLEAPLGDDTIADATPLTASLSLGAFTVAIRQPGSVRFEGHHIQFGRTEYARIETAFEHREKDGWTWRGRLLVRAVGGRASKEQYDRFGAAFDPEASAWLTAHAKELLPLERAARAERLRDVANDLRQARLEQHTYEAAASTPDILTRDEIKALSLFGDMPVKEAVLGYISGPRQPAPPLATGRSV